MRAHGKGGREIVEAVLLRLLRRALETQIKALFAPRTTLTLLLISLCRVGELRMIIFTFEHFYIVLRGQERYYPALFAEPVFIFLCGVDVRVEVEHGDIKIFCQIFEHITAARSAAAVQQQGRHTLLLFYFINFAVEFELIVDFVHLNASAVYDTAKGLINQPLSRGCARQSISSRPATG